MTVNKILDKLLPYTKEELRCGFKKQKKSLKRIKLAEMIELYLNGNSVDWSSLDITETKVTTLLNS